MDLGVNIDHVATLRQARGTDYPDPPDAVRICEAHGADLNTLQSLIQNYEPTRQ